MNLHVVSPNHGVQLKKNSLTQELFDNFFFAILKSVITSLDLGRLRNKIHFQADLTATVPEYKQRLDLNAAPTIILFCCLRVTVYYSQLESGGKRTDSLWFTGPVKRKFNFFS